jgi:hypothetical protein
MRELPRFAFLSNSEIPGIKIISLEFPYIIASVIEYNRDDERKEEMMESMVQGRYPIAKIKGYSIFLKVFTSLEPCDDPEIQQEDLNDMAQFFLEEKISRKPGQFMKSEESGKAERAITRQGERMKRERIKRTKEDNQ